MDAPTTTRQRAILFIRHGETDYNRRHVRCGGDVDIPLTELGETQARQAGQWLRAQPDEIDAIIASPLLRTRRTAEIIHAVLGRSCPVISHEGLIERRLGAWNGMDIVESQPLFDATLPPPGGETEEAFRARIQHALTEILALPYRLPLLVASKGVARMLGLITANASSAPANNAEVMRFHVTEAL